jgi:hypothetical protein
MIQNEIRIIECDRWEIFTENVRSPKRHKLDNQGCYCDSGAIYRGHSDPDWRLSSSMERNSIIKKEIRCVKGKEDEEYHTRKESGNKTYDDNCKKILNNFRRLSKGLSQIPNDLTDFELWVIGRHYGLLSPYLDWTNSPYVAAFFAFEEIYKQYTFGSPFYRTRFSKDKFVNVWGLRYWPDLVKAEEFEIFECKSSILSRARAQNACFSLLKSNDYIDIASYLKSRGILHYLELYRLPHSIAIEALSDLILMNINYITLYPDVFGVAMQSSINSDQFLLLNCGEYK